MNSHALGTPRTYGKYGQRRRGESAMVTELAIVLRSVVERIPRFRSLGFYVPFKWAVVHLDDDPDLARKVLSAAGFVPDSEGRWSWRRGLYPLSKVTDMDALGDTLVSVVDFHRPIFVA